MPKLKKLLKKYILNFSWLSAKKLLATWFFTITFPFYEMALWGFWGLTCFWCDSVVWEGAYFKIIFDEVIFLKFNNNIFITKSLNV